MQTVSNPEREEIMRLNLALLSLALGVESISRPDPESFLQEQMRLWHQGSEMWLHELLESEGTVESHEVGLEFLPAPLPLVPEQTHQKLVVPFEALTTSPQEI
jgi:hypothetical protein